MRFGKILRSPTSTNASFERTISSCKRRPQFCSPRQKQSVV
jgi:hypothetical protein